MRTSTRPCRGSCRSAFGFAGQKCSARRWCWSTRPWRSKLLERLRGGDGACSWSARRTARHRGAAVIEREAHERVMSLRRGRGEAGPDRARRRCRPRAGSARRRWPGTCPPTPPCWRGGLRADAGLVEVESERGGCLRGWTRCHSPSPAGCSRAPGHRGGGGGRTPVGNLYVNRATPARWWAASPSAATGDQASEPRRAGPITCWQFCEPRVVSENTVRHGLAMG